MAKNNFCISFLKARPLILFLLFIAGTLGLSSPSNARNAPITCAFKTYNGHYLTAVGGGGRLYDVIHSDATTIRAWEKFTLIDQGNGAPIHYAVKTSKGYYLTAVDGGGRITDVIRSNATRVLTWEEFTVVPLTNNFYAIQTTNGHYLTAVSGGGRITDVIHSDATRIGAWEKFQLICGL